VQAGLGLFTGVMVYSTAFGGLFALVFAAADGRAVNLGPRAVSALLAASGFIAVYVVPNLKYPASPPSVGQPDTIGHRTALYVVMLALSVAAMVVAAVLRKRLVARHGRVECSPGSGRLLSGRGDRGGVSATQHRGSFRKRFRPWFSGNSASHLSACS